MRAVAAAACALALAACVLALSMLADATHALAEPAAASSSAEGHPAGAAAAEGHQAASASERFGMKASEAMELAGYQRNEDGSWHGSPLGIDVTIRFDKEARAFAKNGYLYPCTGGVVEGDSGELYASSDDLGALLGCTFTRDAHGDIAHQPNRYPNRHWHEGTRCIAHAGGGWHTPEGPVVYTNSLEALQQNWNLGFRIFEFDLYPTSDKQIACVHSWEEFDHDLSAQEWRNARNTGVTPYTTMMLEDLVQQMVINPDLFVVTDTKSFEFADEADIVLPFREICRLADQIDPTLKDRFIPQVYSPATYRIVKAVYDFPSIILTTYVEGETPVGAIIAFASMRDDIDTVTMLPSDKRATREFFDQLHKRGKRLFTHTINDSAETCRYARWGFDGVYTDFVTPAQANLVYAIPEVAHATMPPLKQS